MPGKRRSSARLFMIVPLLLGLSTDAAWAIEVQRVVGATGIRSWLVEGRQLPIIVLDFAFLGAGSVADPPGREGLANFGARMMLEGAGDLDATAFQNKLSEIGAVLAFTVDRDALVGHLEVASEYREKAFDLLRLTLTRTRFDADAIERVRRIRSVELARLDADPSHVADRTWWQSVFSNHPYGRDPEGSSQGIAAVSAEDLRTSFMPRLTRSTLVVGAAGAIDAQELAITLDRLFEGLPSIVSEASIPKASFGANALQIIKLPFPQSVCVFGQPGVRPDSADYLPALILNHVIGGATLTSRLFVEMREKRGLVYSVRTSLESLSAADLVIGRFSTENAKVRAAIDIVKGEWHRVANGDVADEEVQQTKDHLKAAFPLSMDGTAATAAKLLATQRLGFDIDYIMNWGAMVDAVDPDAVRATARRIVDPQALTFAVAGKPEGM